MTLPHFDMLDITLLPKKFTHTREGGNFMFPQYPQVPTNLFSPTNVNIDPHINTYNRLSLVYLHNTLIYTLPFANYNCISTYMLTHTFNSVHIDEHIYKYNHRQKHLFIPLHTHECAHCTHTHTMYIIYFHVKVTTHIYNKTHTNYHTHAHRHSHMYI